MDEVFDAVMTIHAIEFCVNRFLERIRRKDQGDRFAGNRSGGGGVQVAVEAIGVRDLFRSEGRESKTPNPKSQTKSKHQTPGGPGAPGPPALSSEIADVHLHRHQISESNMWTKLGRLMDLASPSLRNIHRFLCLG
jgi:hypothetical protein